MKIIVKHFSPIQKFLLIISFLFPENIKYESQVAVSNRVIVQKLNYNPFPIQTTPNPSSEYPYEKFITSNGRERIVVDGHVFKKLEKRQFFSKWACSQAKVKKYLCECRAIVHRDKAKISGSHNHGTEVHGSPGYRPEQIQRPAPKHSNKPLVNALRFKKMSQIKK